MLRNPECLEAQFAACRSVADVATELGCTDRTVYRAATRLGVERPQTRRSAMRRHLLDDEAWLRAQRAAGTAPRHIARHLGVTIPEVNAALDKFGLPHHQETPPKVDRAEVHRLLGEGLSMRSIARRTSVDHSTIRRIAAKRAD